MPSQTQSLVRAVLRESGPLSLDEILARVQARQPITSKNPKQTIRNALTNDRLCRGADSNRYVYLPSFVQGASLRPAIDEAFAAPEKGLLAVGADLFALLYVMEVPGEPAPPPTLALEGGPIVVVEKAAAYFQGFRAIVRLPAEFWAWWQAQRQAGADALVVRCQDGEAGRFSVRALRTADLDGAVVAARNDCLRTAAVDVLKRTRGIDACELTRRLLAHGVYHGEPPPDPLSAIAFDPAGPLSVEGGRITYRPELTPTLRRLFAHRLGDERLFEDAAVLYVLGKGPSPLELEIDEADEAEESAEAPRPTHPAERGYRIKVTLQGSGGVSRTIEMLDNQTLEDLHDTIQDAFGWDNDHLHAFFLSGRAWDSLTEIAGAYPSIDDYEPPTDDEVTLADLELKPQQRFLYLFDFGDEIRHDVQVVGTFPVPAAGTFPRIVESHGKAPPQYRNWDGEEDDEVDDDFDEDGED